MTIENEKVQTAQSKFQLLLAWQGEKFLSQSY